MKNLSKHTPTELLKILNDTKKDHESLKDKVIQDTEKIDEIEKEINLNLEKITDLEKLYVQIIEELDKRK
ncbi:MAG: hypothetical protein ACOC33_03505 [bacterium]